MSDITLTESEAQTLARCLSEHSEPPSGQKRFLPVC
jgi:hypothetical protein